MVFVCKGLSNLGLVGSCSHSQTAGIEPESHILESGLPDISEPADPQNSGPQILQRQTPQGNNHANNSDSQTQHESRTNPFVEPVQ